jgi:hypothetical protein
MFDRQVWHTLQGVASHVPTMTQVSRPVVSEQEHEGVAASILQNSVAEQLPFTLQCMKQVSWLLLTQTQYLLPKVIGNCG